MNRQKILTGIIILVLVLAGCDIGVTPLEDNPIIVPVESISLSVILDQNPANDGQWTPAPAEFTVRPPAGTGYPDNDPPLLVVLDDQVIKGKAARTLNALVEPSNALFGITWESSDPGVAVYDIRTMQVIGLKNGTVTFTFTSIGKMANGEHAAATQLVTVENVSN